jgi:tetratricopeptide (TPR) repeat protein
MATAKFLLPNRTTRLSYLVGAVLMVCVPRSGVCQIDLLPLPPHNSPAQQLVSKNELLTPARAQKEFERAKKDFLHQRYDAAQRDVQRALAICPHCGLAFTFEGILNLHSEEYPQAAQAFQRAIDEDPESGVAYLGLGIIFNAQGRFKEALIPLDRAAPFLQSTWLLNFEAALAHLGVGQSEAGRRDISSAEALMGGDRVKQAGVAYLRGVLHLQTKDFDSAKRFFDEAVRHDPNGTFAMLATERLKRVDSLDQEGAAIPSQF